MKTLNNTSIQDAKTRTPDIELFGDGNSFKLLCKASSKREKWMKSTKAMQVFGGCVVQVTTQQENTNGSHALAEAVTFVPGVAIKDITNHAGGVVGRELVALVNKRAKQPAPNKSKPQNSS